MRIHPLRGFVCRSQGQLRLPAIGLVQHIQLQGPLDSAYA